jgi:addiction module HigA family antidote
MERLVSLDLERACMTNHGNVSSPPQHPGLRLADEIKKLGKNDAWLADQTGLSRPLVSQLTNGNRRMTSRSAQKICDALGGEPMQWIVLQRQFDLYVETQKVTSGQGGVVAQPGR